MKLSSFLFFLLASTLAASPTLEEILEKMHATDQSRQSQFTRYTGLRSYTVTTPRIGLKANMQAEVNVLPNGVKQFKIISISGPGPLRKLVFQRMLDTEAAASQPDAQTINKIHPNNYDFKLIETRLENGRPIHVLSAEPYSYSKGEGLRYGFPQPSPWRIVEIESLPLPASSGSVVEDRHPAATNKSTRH